jgi:ABC-type dipeptide/oligopeptide/nickel transport system ATPase subunit
MPPFARKCLVLIGPHGVGRRTLKSRLISLDPERFGTTKPRKKNNNNKEKGFFVIYFFK